MEEPGHGRKSLRGRVLLFAVRNCSHFFEHEQTMRCTSIAGDTSGGDVDVSALRQADTPSRTSKECDGAVNQSHPQVALDGHTTSRHLVPFLWDLQPNVS